MRTDRVSQPSPRRSPHSRLRPGPRRAIPGVNAAATTDLPVLLPADQTRMRIHDPVGFSRWLSGISPRWIALLALLIPTIAIAASRYTYAEAFSALFNWMPLLITKGFLFNVLISVLTMLIGTVAGVILGLCQISIFAPVRWVAKVVTQTFRNSPWLVLLFIVLLALPFEVKVFGMIISIPDWMKAVFGLSLPIMANIAEVLRGAIQSVPSGQWEAAESLAYSRQQTLWRIILPQCFKRMIPPWMNWYAILTMATPLCSLLGVEELITLSRQAIESEDNHPELLVPFYTFALVLFFVYCYPIARATIALEKKFAVKF